MTHDVRNLRGALILPAWEGTDDGKGFNEGLAARGC